MSEMEESLNLKNKRPSSSEEPGSSKRNCTRLIAAEKVSNALECDICFNVFSDDNCPRILTCSHTFCGPCIDGIIATQKQTCPTCREEFRANSAGDLVINRSLLDVAKQFSTLSVEPKKKFIKESVQETKTRVLGKLKVLNEMKGVFTASESLSETKDGLLDTKKEIGRFKEILRDTELSIELILGKIDESGDQLEAVTDFASTELFYDAEEKVKEIKEILQKNQRERDDITKEIVKIKGLLGHFAEEMHKFARFAVKRIEGKQMVAVVGVKPTKQICWSYYERRILPKGFSRNHEALMNSSPRAFLDLAIKGTFLARIEIKVKNDSNLALNFLHVCTGYVGNTFINSPLSAVVLKGEAGEYVFLNKYETPVKKVSGNKERPGEIYRGTPHKAGEVRGYLSDGSDSKFYIVTRDSPNGFGDNCLGIVEEGLVALKNAILSYPNITDIRIVDSGVLLSL
ncbi:uncharacterized protein [Palaemon carinicauda]|uniref:uncharacterized protein n=1 Tax=Palaemon carinicauda TaxID=392227 RepID=UPI0035B65A25